MGVRKMKMNFMDTFGIIGDVHTCKNVGPIEFIWPQALQHRPKKNKTPKGFNWDCGWYQRKCANYNEAYLPF